jgi:hydroxyethylthiazole kinase-like sugar kinase family protein
MKAERLSTRISAGCAIAALAAALIALSPTLAKAEEMPWGCMAVTKAEYNAAKKKKMLHGRMGDYRTTGRIWRRSYWLCR